MARHFQIQHFALTIDDPLGLVSQPADRLLAPFARSVGPHELDPGRMRLEVHQDPRRAVHCEFLPRVWQGSIDAVSYAVSRRGPRRRIDLQGRAVLDFDLQEGWAHLKLVARDDRAAQQFLLLRLVCDGLTRGGHSFVHAACLAAPRREGWGGVILSAPSNTGKTTTALALAGSGWRLLGDDIAYVRPPHAGSLVWGFPRACHVRPGSLPLVPWLEQRALEPPGADGAHALPLAALGERAWIAAPWLKPALIVVLTPPNRRATRVEMIDRAEALSLVGGESIDAAPDPTNDEAARNFVTLGRLVCAVPACRVSVGPRPSDVAGKLEQFLDEHQRDHADAGRRRPAQRRAS